MSMRIHIHMRGYSVMQVSRALRPRCKVMLVPSVTQKRTWLPARRCKDTLGRKYLLVVSRERGAFLAGTGGVGHREHEGIHAVGVV